MNAVRTSLGAGFRRRDTDIAAARVLLGVLFPIAIPMALVLGVAVRIGWFVGQVWIWALGE